MKKFTFAFLAILGFSSAVSAADLYVRDFGAGGAYATISAAITAAADGDRIIIKPKAGGIPYLENLVIDKSLTLVSETNFAKYLVQGSVTITPAPGRVVTINNLNCTSGIITAATIGGRTTINVLNSIMFDVVAYYSNTTLNISGCAVTQSIYFTHGKCIANACLGIYVSNILGITTTDSNLATEDIEIIANKISGVLDMNQRNYNFKILNNYSFGGSYFNIAGVKLNGNNEIRNNYINTTSISVAIYINLPTGNTAVISVLNNIIIGSSKIQSSGVASVYAFYNMSNTAFNAVNLTSASNNVGSATFTANNSTFTVTGANVNAGYPDDEYADLDLSLNDIGNFGGSNSWANYWPTAVGNKPQVNYLNTPRRIYSGTTTLNAVGSGYSK